MLGELTEERFYSFSLLMKWEVGQQDHLLDLRDGSFMLRMTEAPASLGP